MSELNSAGIPLRSLGRTGAQITALGLGGYHLGTIKDEQAAIRLVQRAVAEGLTFMDNAWEYHDGRSEELMGKALQGLKSSGRDEVFLMSKVCTHGRDRHEAMRQLEDSLRRLRTDYLDLWQVHELAFDNDPELHFAQGGVIEALEQARQEGKVRFVGFTGHKSPEIHLKMLAYQYPFDTCQLPLNCFDATFRSFERQVLPELERQGIAALAMKSLGGVGDMVKAGAVTAEEALRYALSLPVAAVISGIESEQILEQNLSVVRGFAPLSADEMQQLRERCAQLAADGRFELYKVTAKHEGPIGRAQHGFPPPAVMRD
jgi:aryl-alcohol dehydrogenase-like predicted oxidoreductase